MVSDIEKLAFEGGEAPDGLNFADTYLFLALRYIYGSYKAGMLSKEKAAKEKVRILSEHTALTFSVAMINDTSNMRNRLSHHLSKITKSGCPMCKKAVEIFDGMFKGGVTT